MEILQYLIPVSIKSMVSKIMISLATNLCNPADDGEEIFTAISEKLLCKVSVEVVHSVLREQSSTDVRTINCDTKCWFWNSDIFDVNQLFLSNVVHLELSLPGNTNLSMKEETEKLH